MAGKFGVSVRLLPQGSQVLVVGFGLLCAISLWVTLWSFHEEKPFWLPCMFTVLFGGLAFAMWMLSYKRTDMKEPAPTSISDSRSGINISTDTRILGDAKGIMQLAEVFSVVAMRQPVPSPDGMVSPDGSADTARADEARKIVDESNASLQRLVSAAVGGIRKAQQGALVEQPQQRITYDSGVGQVNVASTISPEGLGQ